MLSPSSDATAALVFEPPGDEFYVVPASFAQQRLWLLDCLSPGLASYNVPLALRLAGRLEHALLAGALATLTDRHEALRTALAVEEGEPVQIIAPRLELPLPRVDFEELGAGAEAAALELVRRESARPFDLGRPPLVRALLLRLAADEHVLFLNLHHAITDAWSLGILVRELLDLYQAVLEHQPACLPDLPIQFADFAAWQREWLQGQVLEHKLQAWRRLLAGAPAELDLPTDRPRSRASGQAGRILPFALPESQAAVLFLLARDAEATLFMVLLASFQALLGRYSGREDLVVGSPVANRGRSETEGVFGFFVNILPLRADLSGRPVFRELLRRVRASAVESYAHEDLPFEKLVEELRPERRLDQNPIFQVAFALQPPAVPEEDRAGLRLRLIEAHSGTAKFELSLHVMQEGAGLRGFWEYSTALFDAATVARIDRHWQLLLAGLVMEPDRPFTELALLTLPERHQLAQEWNDSAADFPREAGILRLFAERAAQHPESPAVVDAGSTLTYGELDRRSDGIAHRLVGLGVRRGDRVGVLLERDSGLVIALLGILKAGAAYLPLDLSYPSERLAWMLADGRADILVSLRSLFDRLPWPAARTLFLDNPEPAEETAGRLPEADADDLAYVLYTSGSTGVPKGVCVNHRAVVRLVRNTDYVRIAPDDVVAQASNASFDAATFEIWGALLNGARLSMMPREVMLSPEELGREIAERGITTLFLTTALFNRMAANVPGCFQPLRHLLFGGEAVDPTRVAAVLAGRPPQRLLHVYGPTEATTFTTWQALREVAPGAWTVPIGRPLANARIHLLDIHLQPVPMGVPGEVYIGGEGLAQGYLDRPDLTAERFVPSPSDGPGERLYRTGDRARWTRAGALEFLGRFDHQIKIRGFRIEPAEVEAALGSHPAVGECVVVARPGPTGELGLVAYVAPQAGAAPSPRELRSFLQDKLPDYMLPAALMVLPRLPHTPNGKLDRAALPEPSLETEPGGFEAPRGPVEEVLAGIWADVLRIERVGACDNFFDLGGHSLTATQVTSHARTTFRIGLPTRAIFEVPVLRDLAERIADLRRTEQGLELPAITPVPRDRDLPLSFAQQRLWFLDQLGRGETPFYNVAASLRLSGRLDAGLLAQALGEVERRHEALRTTFRTGEDGRAVQVFHAPRPFFLPVVDLSVLTDGAREPEGLLLAREAAGRPFSLADGPLFRAGLLRLAPDRHVLSFALHHIVCDGWSLEILMREVAQLYRALLAGAPSRLPELSIQYADYAQWQRQWLSGDVLESQLGYWRQQLREAPLVLDLPTDRPRPALQTYGGRRLSLNLEADLLVRLQALVREHRATLFMAVLAAFGVVLHRRTGQTSPIVGTPIANRNRPEIEDLIGFFVNSLALCVDLGGNPTLAELLERVREMALGAYAHQDLPFERLVEELQPERDLSRNPVFQVSLSSHSTPWAALDLPGLTLGFLDLGEASELFDLSLQFMESMRGLELGLSYNPDLFDAPAVRRLGLHLERLLAALVADPRQPAISVLLLSETESHQVLREWSTGPTDLPRPVAVAPLFEAWALQTPGAPALVWPGGGLSYAELNREADRLAGRWLATGAGLERVIALSLQRPRDFAVAILAVLKTGAAFLPLDPQLPQERRDWMLEDSGAALVIERLEETRETAAAPPPAPPAEALAYVIYTSGSTGTPKGVMVSQGTLATHCLDMVQRLRLGPGERLLQVASFSFDLSLEELLCPLVSGAAAVLEVERGATAAELARHLVDLQVTAMELSTSHWHDMACEWASGKGDLAGHCLKVIGIGGEAAPSGALHLWRQTPLGDVPIQNGYGPTEAAVTATLHEAVPAGDDRDRHNLPIGRPLAHRSVYVLDPLGEPVPAGLSGELHLGGPDLARGYLGRPALTAESFVPDPFGSPPGGRLYQTGDLARFLPDGSLEFLGRRDRQVKLRGFRVEPGEVETALLTHPRVREAAVELRDLREGKDGTSVRHLVAYIAGEQNQAPPAAELRSWLSERLPAYMLPAVYLELPSLPRSSAGKVDRGALPAPPKPGALQTPAEGATTRLEKTVADLWCELLGLDQVGLHDNFFDLGGHSLLITLVRARLQEQLGIDLSMVDLFEHPTVRALADRLEQALEQTGPATGKPATAEEVPAATAGGDLGMAIAVVGMSGRFPGARDVEQLWRNLRAGVESITFFEERSAGGRFASAGHRVAAGGVLDDVESWDAAFFGVSPREAELMDPQHRLFLECSWEALEEAGYDPERYPGAIGVWGGASKSNYVALLAEAGAISDPVSNHFAGLGNDKDYLTTRTSYKLDLRGPSVNVQTACSTSLVAVHLACQSLLAGECDMALAGGVSVNGQQRAGYFYQPGGVLSPDGRCRAFDAQAAGTVDSDGAGMVVLKRLADALRDGDRVRAVIRGSALNNDGAGKVGFNAPRAGAQAQVIRAALDRAGVPADSLSYIETHGTATALGDPIEISALTEAFHADTDRRGFCAIGSAKTNIGHLNGASGVAGLIKTVLALEHRELPPSLHFDRPNPAIDFASSPFFVCSRLREWTTDGGPRRAGVSSFGVGGTNVHVVVEEAPEPLRTGPASSWQLLPLSARTESALDAATSALARHLEEHPELPLADVAWTLQAGRRAFPHRRIVLCRDLREALAGLRGQAPERTLAGFCERRDPPVAFLFPGQGAQYAGMGRGLYREEPVFRDELDRCFELLRPHLDRDLREALFLDEPLDRTELAQPALFAIEYALARTWMAWGVQPQALLGHSVGEYVAACLAGVMSLPDALALIAARGRLIQSLPPGSMLAIPLPSEQVEPLLGDRLSLAAVNGPSRCVISGPSGAVAALEARLGQRGVACRRLATSHAFHSAMLDPVLEAFAAEVAKVDLRPPSIPLLSNVTGSWAKPEEMTAPSYWVRHLRSTVRFADALAELTDGSRVLLEVGPGRTLAGEARRASQVAVLPSLPAAAEAVDEAALCHLTCGRLWLAGVAVGWQALHGGERRRRVSLPTYPFERRPYWAAGPSADGTKASRPTARPARREPGDWYYVPYWKPSAPPAGAGPTTGRQLLFLDEPGLGARLASRLAAVGTEVTTVVPGAGFARRDSRAYTVHPGVRADYDALLADLRARGELPGEVFHLWSYGGGAGAQGENPFYSLLFLAQAWAAEGTSQPVRITAVASGLHAVADGEEVEPLKALLLGPCRVIPQELAGVSCRSIDLEPPEIAGLDELAGCLLREMGAGNREPDVAWRRGRRWTQDLEPVRLAEPQGHPARLRPGAVVLLTGGLGGIGLALAEHLFERERARLVLVGRSALPARSDWGLWLRSHPPDDPLSRRLRRLQDLEQRGAEVLAISADVTVREGMDEVRRRAEERFGAVHGIVHAAGVPGGGILEWKRPEEAALVLAPKVQGTLMIEQAFRGAPLDFLVLCSSQTSLLGGLGQVDYCAANAFLDAFAQARSARGGALTVAIGWDAWREAGMAVETAAPAALQTGRQASLATALSSAEGADSLFRILDQRAPHVIVSTHDFADHLRDSRRPAMPRIAPSPAAPAVRPEPPSGPGTEGTPIEAGIAGIWQELLGLPRVGPNESFFDLGGDSLVALGMAARLRERYGVDLPLARLLENPTVSALSRVVEKTMALAASAAALPGNGLPPTMVPLLAGEADARPFFIVHPLGGNVLCYQGLARHLGPRPVYGLQAPGLEKAEIPCSRLEELAAHHLEAVRRVQPSGPYLLGGFSMGGAIAYEMARQIVLAGERVGLLALMDTYAPIGGNGYDDLQLLMWKAAMLQIEVREDELARRESPEERLACFLDAVVAGARGSSAGIEPNHLRRLLQVEILNLRAFLDYQPLPLGRPLVFFRCTGIEESPEDQLPLDRDGSVAAWRAFAAAPLTVYEIPASHHVLLDEPWAGIVGQHLRVHIEQVDAESMAV